MQLAGMEDYLLVPAGAVLVIVIAIVLIKKTGGMRKRPAEREFEIEEDDIERERVEPVESDKIQEYRAKIDQLTTSLNVEREKVKAKEAQLKEHEKGYEDELLKVSGLKDEVVFLRKKVGELQKEQGESKAKFEAEIEESRKEAESKLANEKGRYEEEIQRLEKQIEDNAASSRAEMERVEAEAKTKRSEMIGKHREELDAKDEEMRALQESSEQERENLKNELLAERQDLIKSYEEKISEVKARTKDTIQRLVDEKDGLIDRLKGENERLEEEVDKLKEQIRLLEVDRL